MLSSGQWSLVRNEFVDLTTDNDPDDDDTDMASLSSSAKASSSEPSPKRQRRDSTRTRTGEDSGLAHLNHIITIKQEHVRKLKEASETVLDLQDDLKTSYLFVDRQQTKIDKLREIATEAGADARELSSVITSHN